MRPAKSSKSWPAPARLRQELRPSESCCGWIMKNKKRKSRQTRSTSSTTLSRCDGAAADGQLVHLRRNDKEKRRQQGRRRRSWVPSKSVLPGGDAMAPKIAAIPARGCASRLRLMRTCVRVDQGRLIRSFPATLCAGCRALARPPLPGGQRDDRGGGPTTNCTAGRGSRCLARDLLS